MYEVKTRLTDLEVFKILHELVATEWFTLFRAANVLHNCNSALCSCNSWLVQSSVCPKNRCYVWGILKMSSKKMHA